MLADESELDINIKITTELFKYLSNDVNIQYENLKKCLVYSGKIYFQE